MYSLQIFRWFQAHIWLILHLHVISISNSTLKVVNTSNSTYVNFTDILYLNGLSNTNFVKCILYSSIFRKFIWPCDISCFLSIMLLCKIYFTLCIYVSFYYCFDKSFFFRRTFLLTIHTFKFNIIESLVIYLYFFFNSFSNQFLPSCPLYHTVIK